MKLAHLLLCGGFLLVMLEYTHAQQEPLYSQYMNNKFLINPSLAGCYGQTSFSLMARQQWMGYDKYPNSYWASAQYRLLKRKYKITDGPFKKIFTPQRKKSNVGLGGFIYNDRIGLLNKTDLNLSYGYHVFLNRRTQLSFGLALNFYQFSIDKSEIRVNDKQDPIVKNSGSNLYIPDFNFGMYLRYNQYFIGISSTHLLESILQFGNSALNYKYERHYFLMGGTRYNLLKDIKIIPELLVKTPESINFQTDFSCRFLFKDLFWTGIGYRTNGDMILLTGVKIKNKVMSRQLNIGYAFDYPFFSRMKKGNMGSHEIVLKFIIGSKERRLKWRDRY